MRLGEERRNQCSPLLHICGPQHRALGRTPGIPTPGPHGTRSLGRTVKGSTLYRLQWVSKWAEGSSLWRGQGDARGSCPGSRLVSFDFKSISAGRNRKNIITLGPHSG